MEQVQEDRGHERCLPGGINLVSDAAEPHKMDGTRCKTKHRRGLLGDESHRLHKGSSPPPALGKVFLVAGVETKPMHFCFTIFSSKTYHSLFHTSPTTRNFPPPTLTPPPPPPLATTSPPCLQPAMNNDRPCVSQFVFVLLMRIKQVVNVKRPCFHGLYSYCD